MRLSAAGLDKFVALLSDGTARAFSPPLSALPNPPPPPDTVASSLPAVQGATDLAQGLGFYCFVTALGSVWCAGSNEDNRLGYDYADVKSSDQPLVVPGVVGAKRVFAGPEANGACAVLQDATAVCWGQGVAVPKAIAGISDVTQVARGPGVTFLRQSDGSVWAWGSNTRGQCGIEPPGVDVQGPTLLSVKLQQVQIGTVTACGVDLQDQIRCWGANDYGLLGTGTATSETATPQVIDMGSKFKPSALGVGELAACASDASLGLTYCWGQKWSTTPKISPTLSGTQTLGVGKAACGVFSGQISCWSNFYSPSIVQFPLALIAVGGHSRGAGKSVSWRASAPDGAGPASPLSITRANWMAGSTLSASLWRAIDGYSLVMSQTASPSASLQTDTERRACRRASARWCPGRS